MYYFGKRRACTVRWTRVTVWESDQLATTTSLVDTHIICARLALTTICLPLQFFFVIIVIIIGVLLLLLFLYFGRTCSRHVIHSLMERNDTHYTPHRRSRSIVSVGSSLDDIFSLYQVDASITNRLQFFGSLGFFVDLFGQKVTLRRVRHFASRYRNDLCLHTLDYFLYNRMTYLYIIILLCTICIFHSDMIENSVYYYFPGEGW